VITPENDRPIFVVGCPRSGTTLLQVMLFAHPRLAVPPETRFLIRSYMRRHRFGDLEDPANRAKVARFITRREDTWFADLGLDADAVTDEIVAGPPTIGSALGIVLRAYAERFGKQRWGDKRPGYHRQIEVLLRLFPDAQFIHLVRDPRDCVASLKRMTWWHSDSVAAMLAWAQAIDNVARARERWPDVIIEMQYERLVADPEPELRRLCAFLGEEYDPAMTEPQHAPPDVVPDRKHWHENARRAPTTAPIGRFTETLTPTELALCEAALRQRMKRFGYEPTKAKRAKPGQLLGYARRRREMQRTLRHWVEHELSLRAGEPNPVAARLTSGQRLAVAESG
jgi:hypothetical protein